VWYSAPPPRNATLLTHLILGAVLNEVTSGYFDREGIKYDPSISLCESKCPYLGSNERTTLKVREFREKFPFSQFSTGETVEDASVHKRGREGKCVFENFSY